MSLNKLDKTKSLSQVVSDTVSVLPLQQIMFADNKSEHSTDDDSEISQDNNTKQYLPLKNNLKTTEAKCCFQKRILAQSFVTGAVMLSSASCGMPIGYSAVLLPQLKYINETMQIDDEIGSWIASAHSAATPFGSLLSVLLMDRCGRKLALQIASLPLIVGWVLIGLSHNHAMLLAGRIIAGLSTGLTAAAGQVLIGEISEPNLRGIFSSVPFASYSFGILLVYALGSVLSWRYVAGLSTILPIISIITFFFLPESPVWLVRKERQDDAKKALIWLRGGNVTKAKEEVKHLVQRVQLETNNLKEPTPKLMTLLQPEVLKPFVIINIFNLMQIFSGTYLIVFYAVDIISHINGNNIDHFLAAVFTAGIRFIFTIVGSILLVVMGRRTLAMSSGIGTAITSLCLGMFLYFQTNCQSNGYFAALCILIYVASNTIGFMILPGVMLGELYPAKIRGLAGGITFMLFHFVLFISTKIFPYIKNLIGIHGIFWLFGVSSLTASVFLYLMLPETKGKTLSQIEDYFQQGNVMWITRNRNKDNKRIINETEAINV